MTDWLGAAVGGYRTFESCLDSPNSVFRVNMKIPEFFCFFNDIMEGKKVLV